MDGWLGGHGTKILVPNICRILRFCLDRDVLRSWMKKAKIGKKKQRENCFWMFTRGFFLKWNNDNQRPVLVLRNRGLDALHGKDRVLLLF